MKIKIITSLDELPQLSTEHPTFCDIETEDLYVKTRLIQFYQPETEDTVYIFDVAPLGGNLQECEYLTKEVIKFLEPLHTVWYNASYDLGTLNFLTEKIDDLQYAVKTAYYHFGAGNFKLNLVVEKLGFGRYYAGLDKKALQKAGFVRGAYLSENQIRYSAVDVYVLSLMWKDEKIQAVINKNMAYAVDILSLRYAIQYQQNGLVVDLETRNTELNNARLKVTELSLQLPEGLNVNSYIQVRKYLDTEQSDNEALVKYALSDKALASKAKVIIDLKKFKKQVTYLESINFNKMYTKFNPAGAVTGRFTSSGGALHNGFNAQQIPRPFQKLFKADTEDTTVIGLDYATLELRLACTIFGEEEMYKQLMEGEDIHTSMASMITGKSLHEDGFMGDKDAASGMADVHYNYLTHKDRTDAKSVNFGYVFGMSAGAYVNYAFVNYGVKVTQEEAVDIREKYFKKYPKFRKYHQYVWNNYKKPMFCYTTALGRKVKPKLGTDGINGPVQGTGAETTKLATHFLIKKYPEAIKYVFNVVHDAIYLRVPKDEKELWNERLKEAMVKGWTEISKTSAFHFKDIPMPVDV